MKDQDFALAMDIVSKENNCKVSFNVPRDGSYSNAERMVINECNAHTVSMFISHGFSLYLKQDMGGLIVAKH